MEKIPSFTVDHLKMSKGIFVSRKDTLGKEVLTTFDLRMVLPNREEIMNIQGVHTIEHIGATFLRNHKTWGDSTVYFGPMGCCTGFYLILKGDLSSEDIIPLVQEMYTYIAGFEGDIPGGTPKDCGCASYHDLPEAREIGRKYLQEVLSDLQSNNLTYP